MRTWLRWRTRRTLYVNLSKLLVIIDKLAMEMGPLPSAWCREVTIELEFLLSIQKFNSTNRIGSPYDSTMDTWMADMHQIGEEWTKKGNDWKKTLVRKNKLNTLLKNQITAAKEISLRTLDSSTTIEEEDTLDE